MDMRERRDVALARIGDDELEAIRNGVAQPARGREGRKAARRAVMRDDRIVADEKGDIGLAEHMPAARPAAILRGGVDFRGLVERDAGVEMPGAQPLRKGHGRGDPGAVLEAVGACINGDAVRPMLLDQRLQPCGNLVERGLGGDRLEAMCAFLLRGQQPLGMMMRLGQLATLDAGIAAEHRVLGIARHAHDAVPLGLDQDRAIGVAEPAEAALDGHDRTSLGHRRAGRAKGRSIGPEARPHARYPKACRRVRDCHF